MPIKQIEHGRERLPTRGRPRKTNVSTLTAKQHRFVVEYFVDLNATQAAIRAGYAARSASVTATRLLKHPAVAAGVFARAERHLHQVDITAERVLDEAAKIAFADPRRLFDAQGRLLPPWQLPDDIAPAVAVFDLIARRAASDEIQLAKIRLWSKVQALELLAKHFGLLRTEAPPPPPRSGPAIVVVLSDATPVREPTVRSNGREQNVIVTLPAVPGEAETS